MNRNFFTLIALFFSLCALVACNDSKTYIELREEEDNAIEKYLTSDGRWVADIPADTDLSRLELRYEGYYASDFVNVNFKFEFWPEQRIDYQPESIATGDLVEGEWATYAIPFQSFSNAANYGELADKVAENGGTVIFHPESNTSGIPEHVQFYIDNVRIYVRE